MNELTDFDFEKVGLDWKRQWKYQAVRVQVKA